MKVPLEFCCFRTVTGCLLHSEVQGTAELVLGSPVHGRHRAVDGGDVKGDPGMCVWDSIALFELQAVASH